MKKRLTVHLLNVPKTSKNVKDKNGEIKAKEILINTLAFIVDSVDEATLKVKQLKERGALINKYYLSNII